MEVGQEGRKRREGTGRGQRIEGRELLLSVSRACNLGPQDTVCIVEWREESRGQS